MKFKIEKPKMIRETPELKPSTPIIVIKRSTYYLNWAVAFCVVGGVFIDGNLIATGSCLEVVSFVLMIVYMTIRDNNE